MSVKTIALLTGGGDCPGLNPTLRSVTLHALEHGIHVIGIKEGWQGLVSDLQVDNLTYDSVLSLDRQGGTQLKSSRTNPYKIDGGAEKVLKRIKELNINALVAIGGEDTLGVAAKLYQEHKMPVIGIPKTIDGDLSLTDYCLGFESAVEIITHAIDTLRSTAYSHDRTFVVEVMGRHAGHLALKGGISAGADFILLPEHQFCMEKLLTRITAQKRQQNYSIIVVAEGATPKGTELSLTSDKKDAFGHVRLGGIGNYLAQEIEEKAHLDCRSVILGHLQRGGAPCAFDRRMGHYYGQAAVQAILAGHFGNMVSLTEGRICLQPLKNAVELRLVDVPHAYDTENYRAQPCLLKERV